MILRFYPTQKDDIQHDQQVSTSGAECKIVMWGKAARNSTYKDKYMYLWFVNRQNVEVLKFYLRINGLDV